MKFIIWMICLAASAAGAVGAEGQIFIVAEDGQSLKMSAVRVGLFKRKDIEACIESARVKFKAICAELESEIDGANEDSPKFKEFLEKVRVLSQGLPDKIWELKPLKVTRTDAEGKFKIDLPDGTEYALFATASRKVRGFDYPQWFLWILVKEDIEEPLILSNFNQFAFQSFDSPTPLGLKNNAKGQESRGPAETK